MSKASHRQLIQNLAPSTIVRRQCDIRILCIYFLKDFFSLLCDYSILCDYDSTHILSAAHLTRLAFFLLLMVVAFRTLTSGCLLFLV